jgi:hypothetical protein
LGGEKRRNEWVDVLEGKIFLIDVRCSQSDAVIRELDNLLF